MRLYFVRHGQSQNNEIYELSNGSKGRSEDPELTALGRQQAQAAGRFLERIHSGNDQHRWDRRNAEGFRFTHIYSSLMLRAVESGSIIADTLGMPLITWKDIHEVGGVYLDDVETGKFIGQPGKPRSYYEVHYPHLILPDWLDESGWWKRHREEKHEAPERARLVAKELMARHGGTQDQVMFVSHGDFYQRFLGVLLDLAPHPYFHLETGQIDSDDESTEQSAREKLGLPDNHWFIIHNAGVTRLDIQDSFIAIVYMNRTDFMTTEMIS
jgi:2,3-bisphosphoglycerate-dependent phosphoglycerate mutase